jgi:hypothetical protein
VSFIFKRLKREAFSSDSMFRGGHEFPPVNKDDRVNVLGSNRERA